MNRIKALALALLLLLWVGMFTLFVIEGGLSRCAEEAAMKSRKVNDVARVADPKVDDNISYRTLRPRSGTPRAFTGVSRQRDGAPIIPVNNIPEYKTSADDGIPSQRDFTIYRLKRRIAELRDAEKRHLSKLTRALAELQSQQRFFDLGLSHGQWESWDELNQRRLHIQATIDLIRDPIAAPVDTLTDEEKERLKNSL